ncbi:MAG: hypothetical protein CVU72_00805 [Deltaproteobacteria bacterium HGW-Deltaproteobacteria-7]|nr:MAG: hypothetical protein CVU72_00805 [Deltaproteobacteria bacterium HGW-Deltaproteobacteria-7]PKN18619.1 MAG: hypothetical protein CVU71_14165 [Deltaproteobacteria bacterium HGW-Deltaproteobacteria-6]
MNDNSKTKQQLIQELAAMRRRVSQLEESEASCIHREDALRENEELYRSMIETSPDPIIMYNLRGELLAANTQAAMTYGVSSVAELLKEVRTVFDFLTEDGKVYAAANFRDTLAEGAAQPREYKLKMRGGRAITAELHSSIVRTATGKPRGFISVVRDITKRKQAEDALWENERLQNTILNNVGAYIYLKDTQYRYTYVNGKVCHLFGVKEDEIIGKDDSSFFNAASVLEIMKSDHRVIEYGETVTREETDLTSSDKLPRTYWAVKLPLKDKMGNICGLCGISTDITELKRTEEELRRLNHVQSLILDNSIMGIAFVRHRIFEWVNSRLSDMLGLPMDRVQGFSVRLMYASDKDYDDREHEIYLALSRGEWFENELVVHRPDGNTFKGRIIGKALNPSVPNEGSIWILEDITDRKRMEKNLRESEEKYRTVVEKANEGIAILQDGCFAYVNPKISEDILGVPAGELIGKPIRDFIHPEDRDIVVSRHQKRLAGENVPDSYEFRAVDKNKTLRWLYVSAKRIQWKGRPATLNLYTDVTERKQMETALEESEAKYRLLVDNSYDLIWTLNADGVFTYVSPSWKRTLGYEPSSMIGKSFQPLVHPDDVDLCTKALLHTIQHRKQMPGPTYRVLRADGAWRWHEASGTPVFGPDGAFISFVGVSRDINDRKQMEEALKRSESQLFSIIEFLPDATFVIDLEGKVIAWNLAIEKMTGVSKEDMLGRQDRAYMIPFYGDRRRHLMDLIDADDRDIESRYRDVQRKGNTLYAEAFAPALYQGKGAYIFVTAAPIFDNRGNRVGTIESIRDVTGIRRAEEELREAHRRLDEIIEYLPDATLVIDTEGKVIAWNKAMEQMTEIQATDMLGKGNYEYALPFYGERRPILIDLVLKSQEEFEARYVSTERRYMALDGEAYMPALRGGEVYLFGRASALRDSQGNIVGAIESIRDITDRRKAEEKYRGIFENAVMGIFQTTPEGRIIDANSSFARILGYESPEEVVSMINDMERQVYANPQNRLDLIRLINEHDTFMGQEVQLLKKDGSPVFVYASGRAVRDGTGNLLYYEGTIQDITDRRRLESQLRQAQKMEAIGTLAGGVAHDFNNILASMMGFTEMAAKETRQDVRRKYHDRVLQACARAKNLVNQILAFSRRREQESRPLDIKLILTEALSLLRATLPATIEIKQQITREETYVLADPTQIHQIMMNLCTNAAHAMREKGGLLDIQLSDIEILNPEQFSHLDLPVGSYVQLFVRDTGHGIDAAIQDKIFDPFFTTKKTKEGTGLGLSVVYGIVKSCGGAIDVQSTVGQGTTFTIYLPGVHPANHTEETDREEADLPGNERILFVDDEEALVSMAEAFFESLGYSITATVSSAEALRLFREKPDQFDLVITDMTMPEITGAELARALLKIHPGLPIILCTGYSDSINMDQVRKLNIREFVLKPVPLHDLGLLVRRVLKG